MQMQDRHGDAPTRPFQAGRISPLSGTSGGQGGRIISPSLAEPTHYLPAKGKVRRGVAGQWRMERMRVQALRVGMH